ncbi:hypothetical protein SAMN05444411_10886 [Lutibacter oricola]|uniref:Alpha-ketoglutarate decarboxylase n=1 Tax=Lutibacter oricola TaxID=762486 RepID=A0A1H3DVS0_9FLAO|nr:hypothetical protein [Lutibacter oricola]SDX70461.1 hypothetical protein SAMN05444411_10886 [Lutibacter oricola]
MHKTIHLLALIISINFGINAQNSKSEPKKFIDNVQFGGGFNIGFGSNYSTLAISPSAIYNFSDEFSAGLSFTYVYVKNKSSIQSTTNLIGGSVLALYKPIQKFQVSLEFEKLNINQKFRYTNNSPTWQDAFYLGAEYVTGRMAVGLRYDLLFDKNENLIYSSALSPVFRIYF